MSDPRPNAAAARAAAPVDRTAGLQVLLRLSSLVRIGRSYQSDNHVFVSQLETFQATLEPILAAEGEAVLVALDTDLYFNGTRVPIRAGNVRFHRHMTEEFRRRGIAGIRVTAGVTAEELQTFFRLFMQPDLYTGADLLQECLAAGTDHIVPAVHASTHAPDAAFDLASALATRQAPTGGSTAPASEPEGEPESAEIHVIGGEPGSETQDRDGAPRGSVRKRFSSAVAGARSLLMTTSLQQGMELRQAKRVVQPLVDGAFADEPVVVGLSSLTHHDEYTYAHAVNVTLVAVTMGHFLEMDRRALADLGVAALLHDVGKSAVAGGIEHPLDAFTPAEEVLAERHPLEGVKILARSTTLSPTTVRCMRVALEHHMGPEGAGYPGLARNWHTSLLSRIVAVADCFVSLQMHRSARGVHVTPFEALGMMLGPLKTRFHPAILWALVQTLGFYPPSQLVELDDGAIAVVLAPNPADLARPHLRPLIAPDGRPYAEGEAPDLLPLAADRSVKRALRGSEYPTDEAAAA